MGFNYTPPDHPQEPGPFPVQHGYADIKFDTHKYNGKPVSIDYTLCVIKAYILTDLLC